MFKRGAPRGVIKNPLKECVPLNLLFSCLYKVFDCVYLDFAEFLGRPNLHVQKAKKLKNLDFSTIHIKFIFDQSSQLMSALQSIAGQQGLESSNVFSLHISHHFPQVLPIPYVFKCIGLY